MNAKVWLIEKVLSIEILPQKITMNKTIFVLNKKFCEKILNILCEINFWM